MQGEREEKREERNGRERTGGERGRMAKRQNVGRNRTKREGPSFSKSGFLAGVLAAKWGHYPNTQDVLPLSMQNQSKIPPGVTGIQRAVEIKKEMKRAKKLEMYSDAIALGKVKSELVEKKVKSL